MGRTYEPILTKVKLSPNGKSKSLDSEGMIAGDQEYTTKLPQNATGSDAHLSSTLTKVLRLEDATYTDCTVMVHGKSIEVNRFVLVAHSPIIKAELERAVDTDNAHIVEITNADYDTVHAMLSYMYAGWLSTMDALAPRLYRLAHSKQMTQLVAESLSAMERLMSIETYVQTAIVAYEFDCEPLLNACTAFSNKKKVMLKLRERDDFSSLYDTHGRLMRLLLTAYMKHQKV